MAATASWRRVSNPMPLDRGSPMVSRAILQRAAFILLGLAASAASLPGQSSSLVDIRALMPQELRSSAFVLPARQAIHIDAVGAEPRRDRHNRDGRWWSSGDNDEWSTWPAAAWILDAATREVVWDLREARTERSEEGLRRYSGTIELPAGVYVAYFGSFVATSLSYSGSFDLASLYRSRRNRRGNPRYDGPYVEDGSFRQFALEITGAGRVATARDLDTAQRALTAATVI